MLTAEQYEALGPIAREIVDNDRERRASRGRAVVSFALAHRRRALSRAAATMFRRGGMVIDTTGGRPTAMAANA